VAGDNPSLRYLCASAAIKVGSILRVPCQTSEQIAVAMHTTYLNVMYVYHIII